MTLARHSTYVKTVSVACCDDCNDELFDGAHFDNEADATDAAREHAEQFDREAS